MSFGKLLRDGTAGGALAVVLLATGCAVHGGYYYDPYDRGYYAPVVEDPSVVQWEAETHRRHENFRHRREHERREYWQWRQQHGGEHRHDRDHDHDRR